jgi:AraC-binding-like domain
VVQAISSDITVTGWPGGSGHLQVKIDQLAVDRALETLLLGALDAPAAFGAALPRQAGAAQDWVRLLLMVHRQLECPDNLFQHSLVWDPLVESLIHGLLLMTEHPYRRTLAAPVAPGRPGAVPPPTSISRMFAKPAAQAVWWGSRG